MYVVSSESFMRCSLSRLLHETEARRSRLLQRTSSSSLPDATACSPNLPLPSQRSRSSQSQTLWTTPQNDRKQKTTSSLGLGLPSARQTQPAIIIAVGWSHRPHMQAQRGRRHLAGNSSGARSGSISATAPIRCSVHAIGIDTF